MDTNATGEDALAPWFPLHPNLTFSAEESEALWTPRPRQPPGHDDNDESDDSDEDDQEDGEEDSDGDDDEDVDPERDN